MLKIFKLFIFDWKGWLLCGVTVLILFLSLELLVRLEFPDTAYHQKRLDRYGWSVAPFATQTMQIMDNDTYARNVYIRYFEHGFKRWGDLQTSKKKLLILGDSDTQMIQVSNGEEYYSYLAKAFDNVELFVYGNGNFGTLQELMVLEDYIDIINPDMILWQFCRNDYRNNSYALDKKPYGLGFVLNRCRPYLEEGRIVYRVQREFAVFRKYFKVIDFMLGRYNRWLYNKAFVDINIKNRLVKKHYKGLDTKKELEKSLEITIELFRMVRQRAGEVPIYFFSATEFGDKEKRICDEAGLTGIPGIYKSLHSLSEAGTVVRVVNDPHWNRLGNNVVGNILVDYFRKHNLFGGI